MKQQIYSRFFNNSGFIISLVSIILGLFMLFWMNIDEFLSFIWVFFLFFLAFSIQKVVIHAKLNFLNKVRKIELAYPILYEAKQYQLVLNNHLGKELRNIQFDNRHYELFHQTKIDLYYSYNENYKREDFENEIGFNDTFELVEKLRQQGNLYNKNGNYYSIESHKYNWIGQDSLLRESIIKIFHKKLPNIYLARVVDSEKYFLISEYELCVLKRK